MRWVRYEVYGSWLDLTLEVGLGLFVVGSVLGVVDGGYIRGRGRGDVE